MSIKLTKRIAADILGRGESSIRIKDTGLEDATKAITRDDVRKLVSEGRVFAQGKKRNISAYSKVLRKKRHQGRRRGTGSKRGTRKARASVEYKQKIRAQRRVLDSLKSENAITNEMFKDFYRLVKGGTFQSKASLLGHIKSKGIVLSDEKFKQLKHM